MTLTGFVVYISILGVSVTYDFCFLIVCVHSYNACTHLANWSRQTAHTSIGPYDRSAPPRLRGRPGRRFSRATVPGAHLKIFICRMRRRRRRCRCLQQQRCVVGLCVPCIRKRPPRLPRCHRKKCRCDKLERVV